jgi:tRNA(Ile)-lysidine synthase
LPDRVAEILSRYDMTLPGQRVGVGVSGGADSVVLLHILARLSDRFEIQPVVLHVNHQLRGQASEDDQKFVAELAESLGFRLVICSEVIKDKGNLEQAARLARRRFFARCIEEKLVERIAVGHNRTDQAETVLFRLLRGAGTAGLAGMRFISDGWLIRPLLGETRSEIRAWAIAKGLDWREDSSNEDRRFVRNRLRLDVIPALTDEFNPNLEGILAGTALVAQDEEAYWNTQIQPMFQQVVELTHFGWIVDVVPLTILHPAVQRRLVRRILAEVRGDLRAIDLSHINAILAICQSRHGHDRVIVPGADVLRSFDRLLFRAPAAPTSGERHYRLELVLGTPCDLPFCAGSICIDSETPGLGNCANFKKDSEGGPETVDLNGDALNSAESGRLLYVRNWEPGDQIHRRGHQGAEKLKSLFQENRVALWERRYWPVLIAGGAIVWARQFGCDARFSAVDDCRSRVRLRYWPSESPARMQQSR